MLATLVCILALQTAASAQPTRDYEQSPNRDDVDPHISISNPNESLRSRLGDLHQLSETEKLLLRLAHDPNLLPKDLQDELRENVKKHPELVNKAAEQLRSNPALLAELQKSREGTKLNEEQERFVRELIQAKQPQMPQPGRPTPDAPPRNPESTSSAPGAGNDQPSAASPPEPKPPEPEKANDYLARQVDKLAAVFNKLGDDKDAMLFRSLARSLARPDFLDSAINDGKLAQMVRRLEDNFRKLNLEQVSSGDWAGLFKDWSLPDLPWPDFSSSGESGTVGLRESKRESQPISPLFWAGLLLLLVLILWKGKQILGVKADNPADRWHLGPWPVSPDHVSSRGDLVKAFEYLAFLLLGRAAQPRNHLALAAALAGTGDAPRQAAANRLAHLYEQARYAPEADLLPEVELASARHDLAMLAGVGRA